MTKTKAVATLQVHCEGKLTDISSLTRHPNNANAHPDDQIERLAKILLYQGFRSPIVVSLRSGFVVAGHGRLEAAIKNGWLRVPVVHQEFESEEQETAHLHADNAIALWAQLDFAAINNQIGDLGPDFDIDMLGIRNFEIEPLDKILGDEDAVPENVETRSKPGDVWILGKHRLMCGDSTSVDAVETLMAGEKADMVFTDPPYGISYQSNGRTKSAKFDVIMNDETFLSEWVNVLPIVSTGWVFVWTTWKVVKKWIEICEPIGELSNLVIWDKGGGGLGDLSKTFATDYEMALVYNRGAEITGKRLGSVWSVGKDSAVDYKHPTQKPVELSVVAIENCTVGQDLVLDLFGGSGSTLIACEKTDRSCRMMELDPHYCDVILTRWEEYTGLKAELSDRHDAANLNEKESEAV